MRKTGIILYCFLMISTGISGESLFGISDHSLGMVHNTYSGAGLARSFETAGTDSLQINYMNYSLWTVFSNTAYSLKGAYSASFGDNGQESNFFNTAANFESAFMIVPIIKQKLLIGAGISPFTNIEQRVRSVNDENMSRELLVRGGLSRALLNVSYRILPALGVGLGYEYNFGKINKRFRLENESEDILPIRLDFDYRYYGHGMVASFFYQPLNNLTLGLSYRPAVEMRVRINPQTTSNIVNKGTLATIEIPLQLNSGLEYRFNERMLAGIDVLYQDWGTGYKLSNGETDPNQTKYFRIGAGIERKQSSKIFTKLSEQIDYRAGFFYTNLNHKSLQNTVSEYGLSFGFSLPLQRFRSRIDFAGTVGKRGSLDRNEYEETFVNFGISINAVETWFINIED